MLFATICLLVASSWYCVWILESLKDASSSLLVGIYRTLACRCHLVTRLYLGLFCQYLASNQQIRQNIFYDVNTHIYIDIIFRAAWGSNTFELEKIHISDHVVPTQKKHGQHI